MCCRGWIWDWENCSDGRPVSALSDHVAYVTSLETEWAERASKSEPFQVGLTESDRSFDIFVCYKSEQAAKEVELAVILDATKAM